MIDQINRHKPDVLSAYGSCLGPLFRYAARHRKRFHKPQIVIYVSSALSETNRQWIGGTLQIPVLSYYNSCEALKIGFTCERGKGFHLHPDLCALYLVDERGNPVEPGKRGEVVISNLINRATVLLNYRLGDLAILETRPCECGRTFPRLRSLEGRTHDVIHLPDGELVPPSLVWNIFKKQRKVERYQVVQDGPLSFVAKVLPAPEIHMKSLERKLNEEFRSLFGKKARIRIEFVSSFPVTDRGKFRTLVALNTKAGRNSR
jgi:phenylacetate-CoA ligase